MLGDASIIVASVYPRAVLHTPTLVIEAAVERARNESTDSIISLGGGSAIGLGKAICIRTGLYHICLPTTYAGSEMTTILGKTSNRQKVTRSDPAILPQTVIYDVSYTLNLQLEVSRVSGVNAITHAVEALYAQSTNPITSLLALEGVSHLVHALPELVHDPQDLSARTLAQHGAWLCGICLRSVGMSLHHKLCHTLGGSLDLPHAQTHAIVLPHVVAYNAPQIGDINGKLAATFPGSKGSAAQGLNVLLNSLKIKRGLKSYGMKEGDIEEMAQIAISRPYWNPREIEEKKLVELLRHCWNGEEASDGL
ncbi:hypothetical protein Q7P35_002191 [Cladosporium inversicolor]